MRLEMDLDVRIVGGTGRYCEICEVKEPTSLAAFIFTSKIKDKHENHLFGFEVESCLNCASNVHKQWRRYVSNDPEP